MVLLFGRQPTVKAEKGLLYQEPGVQGAIILLRELYPLSGRVLNKKFSSSLIRVF